MDSKDKMKGADELFKEGKLAEKEERWRDATQLFEKAAEGFNLQIQSAPSEGRIKEDVVIHYLRSRISGLLNLFRFEFEETDEIDVQRAIDKIELYQKDRNDKLQRYPSVFRMSSSIERSLINKLGESLSARGLKEESSLIFQEGQKLETEILKTQCRLLLKEKKFVQFGERAIHWGIRQVFYNWYLGYGVRIQNLVWSALIILFVFGFLFATIETIEVTEGPGFNFADGLFGSVMTFIGFDFSSIEPFTRTGKWLVSIEGFLGFVTFGGIIAYIWRKLK
ncbi:MAG: hypothetical protein ACOY90_16700 [Candidatus Zhuqueibacterota bacterium]